MLIEGDVEGAGDGVFARVLVARQEDGEALFAARRMGFAEDFNDFGVGEPFGNFLASAKTLAEFYSSR